MQVTTAAPNSVSTTRSPSVMSVSHVMCVAHPSRTIRPQLIQQGRHLRWHRRSSYLAQSFHAHRGPRVSTSRWSEYWPGSRNVMSSFAEFILKKGSHGLTDSNTYVALVAPTQVNTKPAHRSLERFSPGWGCLTRWRLWSTLGQLGLLYWSGSHSCSVRAASCQRNWTQTTTSVRSICAPSGRGSRIGKGAHVLRCVIISCSDKP